MHTYLMAYHRLWLLLSLPQCFDSVGMDHPQWIVPCETEEYPYAQMHDFTTHGFRFIFTSIFWCEMRTGFTSKITSLWKIHHLGLASCISHEQYFLKMKWLKFSSFFPQWTFKIKKSWLPRQLPSVPTFWNQSWRH